MRVPRVVARFNRRITNPAARSVAGWAPTLGILEHVGRNSGKRYRTPLTIFNTRDGYGILIGYGVESNWVQNVWPAERQPFASTARPSGSANRGW
jgi:hypothetical protein